jgi:hypothetical protein
LSNVLRTHVPELSYVLAGFVLLWTLIQPAWLKSVYQSSRAVYWYLSAFGLFASLEMLEHFEGPDAYLSRGWTGSLLVLAAGCCYVAATCYFAGEWRELMQYSERDDPGVNYAWAILLGAYYFQHKLHDLYEDQLRRSAKLTGSPRAS